MKPPIHIKSIGHAVAVNLTTPAGTSTLNRANNVNNYINYQAACFNMPLGVFSYLDFRRAA